MSLSEKLDQIRAGAEENIPAPALEQMHKATAELQNSGILDRMIKPGDPLPAFALPNQADEMVSSVDLLARGPMILTVYRGLW
ncbi:MAG: hypothetical protein HOC70_06030 [Gammaproteobacteria bacterium]|jgi:hypothetical protein|nr:hypothetical protein [Gammaproteobacteria bacterium]MBT4492787.1 hypothetical protein [Gammaproteobacteria bacterium]MBT7370055.1 hypothetical protein [Gammaproteobacteria bacterium]